VSGGGATSIARSGLVTRVPSGSVSVARYVTTVPGASPASESVIE
jgi:hypothetical protein